MAARLFHISGHGGARLANALTCLIAQRQVSLVALSFWVDDANGATTVRLTVDVPNDAAASLLHKRLDRLVGVVKTIEIPMSQRNTRRAIMVAVKTSANTRGQVADLARTFGAEIVDVKPNSIELAYFAEPREVENLLRLLEPYGVVESSGTADVQLTQQRSIPRLRSVDERKASVG